MNPFTMRDGRLLTVQHVHRDDRIMLVVVGTCEGERGIYWCDGPREDFNALTDDEIACSLALCEDCGTEPDDYPPKDQYPLRWVCDECKERNR